MNYRNGFLAFLGGAAVGAVVGILFAPDKGDVTRRKIKKAVDEGKDKIVDVLEEGKDRMMDVYYKGREHLSDVIHKERDMIEREIDSVCKPSKKHV